MTEEPDDLRRSGTIRSPKCRPQAPEWPLMRPEKASVYASPPAPPQPVPRQVAWWEGPLAVVLVVLFVPVTPGLLLWWFAASEAGLPVALFGVWALVFAGLAIQGATR